MRHLLAPALLLAGFAACGATGTSTATVTEVALVLDKVPT